MGRAGAVMSRRRVAVLGAAGFIGASLVHRLRAEGDDVYGCDLRVAPTVTNVLDLRDAGSVAAAVWNCDEVYHLAANMGGVAWFHSDQDFGAYVDNTRVTLNVLEACTRAETPRLFYASSACVYPIELQQLEGKAPLLSEDLIETGQPDQMYGREKLMGLRLCEQVPFDARVGILHTVYGPGQEHDGQRAKFPPTVAAKAIRSKRDGVPLEVWGNGRQSRSYLYIDDAVDKIVTVMRVDRYDGPVNIGAEGAVTCDAVAHLCLDIVGSMQ